MPYTHVEVSQTGFQGKPHEDHDHLKFHRLHETLPTDKSHYLMGILGEIHAGEPIPAHYPGPTVVYVIEGEVYLDDEAKPGQSAKFITGDVIHIGEDSSCSWHAPSYVKMFGASYAPSHMHPEALVVKK